MLAACAAFAGCRRSGNSEGAAQRPPAPRLTIVTERISLEELTKLPIARAVRIRPDVFRLKPDRRSLVAIGEIERLVAASPAVRLRVSWNGAAWQIDSGTKRVGAVPDLATYAQIRGALLDWSRALIADTTAKAATPPALAVDAAEIRKACDRLDPAALMVALSQIGQAWSSGFRSDPEQAALAAHAFVLLSVESLDTLEMADLIRAKALALLALTEALGRPPDTADEALLAATMGYAEDARRLGALLAPDDVVRLFAEERTAALVARAEAPDAAPLTRYLALLSLAARGNRIAWEAFQEKQFATEGFSLPVLRAAAALHSFELNASIGTATLYASLRELKGQHEQREPDPSPPAASPAGAFGDALVQHLVQYVRETWNVQSAGLVRDFESTLSTSCKAAGGPLWDADACESWHRGFFYSGLHTLGIRYLDELGSVEGARDLATYLQGSPPGPAAQFARWYGHLSEILSGHPATEREFEDLAALTALGAPAVERLTRELTDRYFPGRDASAEIGERATQRLDARPGQVALMIRIAADPLLDLGMKDRLCRAWPKLGASADPTTTANCLFFRGDTAGLFALIDRQDLDIQTRATALGAYAFHPGASEALCRSRFRALAIESGYDRAVTAPWIQYLEDKLKDYPASRQAVEGWLAHHDASSGLVWYIYRGHLAHLMSLQGRDREAWQVIEPALESGQAAVMSWACEILWKLGRLEEAAALGREIVDRYPNEGDLRALLAELLWRQKRNSEAAFVLDPPEAGYKVDELKWKTDVSQRFADVFLKQPDDAVTAAFAALRAQKIWDRKVVGVIPPLASAGRNELAFQLQATLSPTHQHLWDVAVWRREGFGYLEKARGGQEASFWIQGVIPPPQRENSLESFFNQKAWELLWDAVPPAEEARQSEWIWLLRAGAARADPAIMKMRGAGLLEHFREPRPRDGTQTLARYLLGLEDRAAVLAAQSAPEDRCKAAYFFGLDDLAAGRYEEGLAWFGLVFDSCTRTWSWRLVGFARSTLMKWYSSGEDLHSLAASKTW